MVRGLRVAALGFVVAAVACGSTEEPPPDSTAATFDELATRLAKVTCASLGECCTEQEVPYDRKSCEALTASYVRENILEDLDDASVVYDAVMGAACLDDIAERVTCGMVDDDGNTLEACKGLFHGAVLPGEPCESGEQCEVKPGQRATCGDDGRCLVYTVRQATRGRLGDTCRADCEGSECLVAADPEPASEDYTPSDVGCFRDDGLYCNDVCTKIAAVGEACRGMDRACTADAYCEIGGSATEGVCAPRREDGEDCFDSPGSCRHDCDEDTFICGPPPPLTEAECRRAL